MKQIQTIGIASGLAGNHQGCSQGPVTLRDSKYLNAHCHEYGVDLHWLPLLTANRLLVGK